MMQFCPKCGRRYAVLVTKVKSSSKTPFVPLVAEREGYVELNQQWIMFALWEAGSNWRLWRSDYECGDAPERMPVLANADRFLKFIHSYGLMRYRTQQQCEEFRQALHTGSDLRQAVIRNGAGIDGLARCFNKRYSWLDIELSLFSKLAAFARPESFIAWDQFARRGVATLAGGPTNGKYRDYSSYLADVDLLWSNGAGDSIKAFLSGKTLPTARSDDAFPRRILDCYLMITGGRWSVELST